MCIKELKDCSFFIVHSENYDFIGLSANRMLCREKCLQWEIFANTSCLNCCFARSIGNFYSVFYKEEVYLILE